MRAFDKRQWDSENERVYCAASGFPSECGMRILPAAEAA